MTAITEQDAPPPPLFMKCDDYNAADPARKRLLTQSKFPSLPSFRKRRHSSTPTMDDGSEENHVISPGLDQDSMLAHNMDSIRLDNSAVIHGDGKDHYQWAILYENQRGMTIFSIPYYSRLSLLPTDPLPFTLPNASSKRSKQPQLSLTQYPLPDGNWRWVSRSWMIDMRSDSGEVQHDGFEYNWSFRAHHWHPDIGLCSAGAWVRRRRWVRLMMRPGGDHSRLDGAKTPIEPPSIPSRTNLADSDRNPDNLWAGIDPDADWERCHKLMKDLGRDGLRLEVWKQWLGVSHDQILTTVFKGKRREKQWTEDEIVDKTEEITVTNNERLEVVAVPREWIVPVLQQHGDSILQSLVYPESRVQFLKLLNLVGMRGELKSRLGPGGSEVDFWSYTRDIEEEAHIRHRRSESGLGR